MSEWSLPLLLAGLHEDIQHRLQTVRKSLDHPGTKGSACYPRLWVSSFLVFSARSFGLAAGS